MPAEFVGGTVAAFPVFFPSSRVNISPSAEEGHIKIELLVGGYSYRKSNPSTKKLYAWLINAFQCFYQAFQAFPGYDLRGFYDLNFPCLGKLIICFELFN